MDEWMLAVAVIAMSLGPWILAAAIIHLVLRLREQDEPGRYVVMQRKPQRTKPAPIMPPHQGSRDHLHGHVSRRPEEPPHGHQPRPTGK